MPSESAASMTEGRARLDPGLAMMYDAAEEVYRWCPNWMAQAIRHVVRNCDIECSQHGYDCETPDRYDGGKIQAVAAYTKSLAVEAQDLRNRVAELEREAATRE